MESMRNKSDPWRWVVIVVLLLITLPLVYLLVARVLLPLEWREPQATARTFSQQHCLPGLADNGSLAMVVPAPVPGPAIQI